MGTLYTELIVDRMWGVNQHVGTIHDLTFIIDWAVQRFGYNPQVTHQTIRSFLLRAALSSGPVSAPHCPAYLPNMSQYESTTSLSLILPEDIDEQVRSLFSTCYPYSLADLADNLNKLLNSLLIDSLSPFFPILSFLLSPLIIVSPSVILSSIQLRPAPLPSVIDATSSLALYQRKEILTKAAVLSIEPTPKGYALFVPGTDSLFIPPIDPAVLNVAAASVQSQENEGQGAEDIDDKEPVKLGKRKRPQGKGKTKAKGKQPVKETSQVEDDGEPPLKRPRTLLPSVRQISGGIVVTDPDPSSLTNPFVSPLSSDPLHDPTEPLAWMVLSDFAGNCTLRVALTTAHLGHISHLSPSSTSLLRTMHVTLQARREALEHATQALLVRKEVLAEAMTALEQAKADKANKDRITSLQAEVKAAQVAVTNAEEDEKSTQHAARITVPAFFGLLAALVDTTFFDSQAVASMVSLYSTQLEEAESKGPVPRERLIAIGDELARLIGYVLQSTPLILRLDLYRFAPHVRYRPSLAPKSLSSSSSAPLTSSSNESSNNPSSSSVSSSVAAVEEIKDVRQRGMMVNGALDVRHYGVEVAVSGIFLPLGTSRLTVHPNMLALIVKQRVTQATATVTTTTTTAKPVASHSSNASSSSRSMRDEDGEEEADENLQGRSKPIRTRVPQRRPQGTGRNRSLPATQ